MKESYVNFTMTELPVRILKFLERYNIPAVIGPRGGQWVAFTDEQSDLPNPDIAERMLMKLSEEFSSPILLTYVYDSTLMVMKLAQNGEVTASYNSDPNYFNEGDASATPELIGVQNIAALSRKARPQLIHQILVDEHEADSVLTHERFVEAMNFPAYSVDFGFTEAIEQSEQPYFEKFVFTNAADRLRETKLAQNP